MSQHHEQDDFYADEPGSCPLLLHWSNLGGDVAVRFDSARGIWVGTFEDGLELRVTDRDIVFIGQHPGPYFHHERFLRALTPVGA